MSELFVFTLAQQATTTTVNIEIFKWLLFHESRSYLTIKKIRESKNFARQTRVRNEHV